MSWSQANYSDQQYAVDATYFEPQPYSVHFSAVSVPAPSSRAMAQSHSASYAHDFTIPRYQPTGYLQTSPQQGVHSFDHYTWDTPSTTRDRSDSGHSNIYAGSSTPSMSASPQKNPYADDISNRYAIHPGQNIQPEHISRTEHYSSRVTVDHDQAELVTVRSASAGSLSSDKTTTKDSKQRMCCPHSDCMGQDGQPQKFFSRKADVTRHYNSQHAPTHTDCPKKNCSRKGAQGFTRKDHLTEHLRGFHLEIIPKREANQPRREQPNDAGNRKVLSSLPPQRYSHNGYRLQSSGNAGVKQERQDILQEPLLSMSNLPDTQSTEIQEAASSNRTTLKRARMTKDRQRLKSQMKELSKAMSCEGSFPDRKCATMRLGHTKSRTINLAQVSNRPSAQQTMSSEFTMTGLSPLMYHPSASPFAPQFPPVTDFTS